MKSINHLIILLVVVVFQVSNAQFNDIELHSSITSVQPMTGIVLWSDNSSNNTDAIQLEYSYMLYNSVVKQKDVYD